MSLCLVLARLRVACFSSFWLVCNCNRNRLFCEFDKYSKEICLKLFSDNKAFIEMYLHFCPFQNPIKLWDDIFDILKYIYTGGELREGGSSKVNENFWRTLQDGNWFRFWHHPLVLIFVFVFVFVFENFVFVLVFVFVKTFGGLCKMEIDFGFGITPWY